MKQVIIIILLFVCSTNIFSQQLSLQNLSNALNKETLNLSEFKTFGYTTKNKKLIGVSKDTISIALGWIMWKGKDENIFKNLENDITKLDVEEKENYRTYNDYKFEKRLTKSIIKNGLIYTINKTYFKNSLKFITVEIMNDKYGSDGE